MKKICLLFIVFVAALSVQAQDIKSALTTNTQEYLNAYIEEDVNTILKYTHPNIIEMGGGEEYLVKDIAGELEMIKTQGLKYIGAEVMDVDNNFELHGEKFFLVPHSWLVEIGGNSYKSVTYVLASTADEGMTWSFINVSKYNAKNLAVYIPGFDESIEFPTASPFEQIFD